MTSCLHFCCPKNKDPKPKQQSKEEKIKRKQEEEQKRKEEEKRKEEMKEREKKNKKASVYGELLIPKPDISVRAKESCIKTPSEAGVYKYMCPICLRYFNSKCNI